MVKSILKNSRNVFVLYLLTAVLISANAAFRHDQSLQWQTLESRHFNIHYHNGAKTIALKTAKISETLLGEMQTVFNWIPKSKIDIIISDEVDFSNGSVMPFLPNSRMTLFVNPPDEATAFDYQDWFRFLIKHELTHTLHLDKAGGTPEFLRNIFGNHPLLFPNVYEHTWIIEGLATYMETSHQMQIGRGQSSEFAMMMRSEVQAGVKPLRQINSKLISWPMRRADYLYGYYFFEFLDTNYGKQSIADFISEYSDNFIPFNLNEAFIKTYNKDIEELWVEFTVYLNNKFQHQIETTKNQGIVRGVPLTNTGYIKQSVEFIDKDNLLIGQYLLNDEPELITLSIYDKTQTHLADIQTDSRVDFHEQAGILVAQQEIYRNTNFFYDIYRIQPQNGNVKRITRGQRMRRGVWSPDGKQIVVVHSKLGQHSLALIENDGKIIDILWEAEHGEVIGNMDWSPQGTHLIASVKRDSPNWNLEEFNLETRTWQRVTNSNANEADPQYTPDGETIFYSADYDGVYNIYRLDREDFSIDKITNVIGGAFQPKISSRGNLAYIGYSNKGYDVFYLEQVAPLLTFNQNVLANAQDKDYEYKDFGFKIRQYNPIQQFAPKWWEPRAYFSETSQRVGAYTSGSDAINRHNYDALLEWDFDAKKASIEFNYSYDRWFPLFQTRILSEKRENYTHENILFEMLTPFLARENRWYFSTSISYEDDLSYVMDENDNRVEVESRNRLFGAGLIWDSRDYHPKLPSVSNGRLTTLVYETTGLTNSTNKGQVLTADWREYINLDAMNVLSLRLTGGLGIETPRPFRLGGSFPDTKLFENSLYSSIQYRTNFYSKRRYPLRGYQEDTPELIGRRMTLVNIEWRFPLSRVERAFPVFPLGLNQMTRTVFYNGGSAWNSGLTPAKLNHAVGVELIADTQWFVLFPVQWRLGFANGFSDFGEQQVYLSLGSSF